MFRPAVLPPPPMVWNREKREREKRSISIIRETRKGSVSSRYNTQDTLISPTGGFYRLQPPSDTRLVVVKISDAPRPGERGRAVNRCRLIEHIHVRGFTPLYPHIYTYIHVFFHRDSFSFNSIYFNRKKGKIEMRQSSYFSIEDVPLNPSPLLFPLPVASKIDFVSSDNDARPLVYRPDGRQLYIARGAAAEEVGGRACRGIDARTCPSRCVYTHRNRRKGGGCVIDRP